VRKLNALQTHTPYFAFTAATHPGISSLARENFATAHHCPCGQIKTGLDAQFFNSVTLRVIGRNNKATFPHHFP
jgi:hypothetical protein